MADTLVTPERLMEAAGMNEENEDAEIFREIIRRFSVTEEKLASMSQKEVAEDVSRLLSTNFMEDYLYLFNMPIVEIDLSELKENNISRVALFTRAELTCETVLVDFEEKTLYADFRNFFLGNVKQAGINHPLDDNTRNELIRLITNFPWSEALTAKNLTEDIKSADYGIAVETKDGVVHCAYYISGADPKWDNIHEMIVQSIGKDAYYGVDDDSLDEIRAILKLDE